MTLSVEELQSIARSWWPSYADGERPLASSPEFQRLRALWGQETKKLSAWRSFSRGLRSHLPGFITENLTTLHDACYRCGAFPNPQPASRAWAVVGCMSILAPIYTLYGFQVEDTGETFARQKRTRETLFFEPLPPEMQRPAEVMARRMEETYGVTRLPREIADIPVPLFVEPVEPPHTSLFHALFLGYPEGVWG